MKVKTANGEVELTAEMVKPGMRFQHNGDDAFTVALQLTADVWQTKDYAHVRPLAPTTTGFLGCDPTIASREDCALYGVAPGIDAGAHGFARLRDGGAVDLRRAFACRGAVIANADSAGRLTLSHRQPFALGDGQRLIGLDARYARPEDVRRLCCGARETADWQDEEGKWQPARWRACTLAISHDGEHENIATGVRWNSIGDQQTPAPTDMPPATFGGVPFPSQARVPAPSDAVSPFPCVACGGAVYGRWPLYITSDNERGEQQRGALCEVCAKKNWTGARFESGRLVAMSWPITGSTQGTLRIGDRDFLCLVTERQPRHGGMGREMVTGPRRVTANLVTKERNVCRALERQTVIELTEGEKQTQMLVTAWTRTHDPQARNVVRLTIELEASIEFQGDVRALLAPSHVLCHARSDIDGGFACTEDKGHAGNHVAKGPDGEVCATWVEPTAEQRRDHAVKRAIADVPEGCDQGGWANVVRVIAADVQEIGYKSPVDDWVMLFRTYVKDARPAMVEYAKFKAFRYSAREAVDRSSWDEKMAQRLFAAYEAGR